MHDIELVNEKYVNLVHAWHKNWLMLSQYGLIQHNINIDVQIIKA